MKIIRLFLILLFLNIFFSGCKTTQVVQPDQQIKKPVPRPTSEVRGLCISPASWMDEDIDKMENNIQDIMEKAADANYNVVIFTVREHAESYFPFPFEHWRTESGEDPEFDPVALAINAAHRNALKFYAGIDLLNIGNDPPGNTRHLYHEHGPDSPADSSWISMGQDGNPVLKNDIYYLNPALPQVKTYLKNVIRHLTENYNIDGFCFDQTDYPQGVFSYDDFSIEKYMADSLQFPVSRNNWANERLTDLIEDITVEAMLVKPYLVNSLVFSAEIDHQNVINLLNEGIVDFLIPKIDFPDNNPIQDLKAYWNEIPEKKEITVCVIPMFSINEMNITDDKITGLVNFLIENGGHGIIWDFIRQNSNSDVPVVLFYSYPDKIKFPDSLKHITPEQVVGLHLSAIFEENISGQTVYCPDNNKRKITDSQGYLGLILFNSDTIEINISNRSIILPTGRWSIPYKYAVQPDNSVIRESPWVEFRRMPAIYTDNQDYHLLCKTDYTSSAWINDYPLKVYTTGIFFNKITLNEGPNRVRASVLTKDSLSAFYECEFNYQETDKTRQPFPLWIDERSIEPEIDIELLQEDVIQISFNGSLGQNGCVEITPGGLRIECSREDHNDYSIYRTELPLRKLNTGDPYKLILKLTATKDTLENPTYEYQLQNIIKVRNLDDFPLVKTIEDNSRLTYNLGPVRLGGPIRSEMGSGVIMKTNGKIGDNYRVRLNRIENGIIRQNNVEELPAQRVQPSYFITNMSCAPTKSADILSIPYLQPVPYAVYPDPDQNRIVVTLFGAITSSTWISHRKGRKIIDKVTWQQTTPETYEVYVNLKTPDIWGYDIRPEGKQLILRIKYPPQFDLKKDKPLSGIKIAVEAGHGGRSTGAIGLSGLQEKDINLDLSLKLAEVCKSMGAEVLQIRDTDKNMSLIEKRDIAIFSDADLLISIHANAAGTSRGYLRVPGTSTYYNNPFWAPLAESIYDRLLELELEEFGVVGSFNYTVIRVSQMPSILVEQAFMTHAEDEEKLADDGFRQRMAEKIYEGIVDYIEYMDK
ncbi:N-acetylmuramoyl-L-alanine amidase [Bacteroidota bacterium]